MAADFDYHMLFTGNCPIWLADRVDLNAPPGQGLTTANLWFPTVRQLVDWGLATGGCRAAAVTPRGVLSA